MFRASVCMLFFVTLFFSEADARQGDYLISRVEERQFMRQNITAITHDSAGFIWFGTENGFFRYDGQTILPFFQDREAGSSIPTDYVLTTHLDSGYRLWLSTRSGGLSLYNHENQSFQNIHPSEPIFQPFDFVSITGSGNPYLWLVPGNGDGIFRFDTNTSTFDKIDLEFFHNRRDESTLTVLERTDGSVLVGTSHSGIVHIDEHGHEIGRIVLPGPGLSGESDTVSYSVLSLLSDHDDTLWIGTYSGGVFRYSFAEQQLDKPDVFYTLPEIAYSNIYDLHLTRDGIIWIGSEDGLLLLDTDTMEILYRYLSDPLDRNSLLNNRIRVIYEDNGANIWVGNEYGGVHKFRKKPEFIHVGYQTGQENGHGGASVRTFTITDKNQLWVAVNNQGIHVYDPVTLERTDVIQHDPAERNSLSSNGVTRFLHDSSNSIWIGTWGGGLNHYDPVTGIFTTYQHDPDDLLTLPDNRIQVLYIDSKDRFWVGTEEGLALFDRDTGHFRRVLQNPDHPPALSQNSLQSLAFLEDESGIIWIGTWNGLNRYDPENHTIRHYFMDFNDPNSLRSNRVISLYDDGEGVLWIGTFGGGLTRLDKHSDTMKTYMQADGLANNVVFAILPDKDGNLWLSTNNGLNRFNPETEFFVTFNWQDGIIGDEFWWGSAYSLPDGRLLFGSTFGFTIFQPSTITESDFEPPVLISSIRVYDRPVFPDKQNNLQLHYRDNQLNIEFASLDFANASRIEYAYMLEGVDRDWNYSGNRNFATYSFLRGGDYTFRVRATNSNGVWSDQEAALMISIQPPLWEMAWFQFILILFILLLIAAYLRIRTKKIQNQNMLLEAQVKDRTHDLKEKQNELIIRNKKLKEQTEILIRQKSEIQKQKETILEKTMQLERSNETLLELNNEKNSLIGLVSHDLRSPLASVLGVIDLFQQQPGLPAEEQNSILSALEDLVQNKLEMVSKILDIESIESGEVNLKIETLNVAELTVEVMRSFQEYARKKEIHFIFHEPDERLYIRADRSYLINQVFENLVSNALKYSPVQSTVELLIQCQNGMVKWGVRDKGPGITADDMKKLFNKYQRLSAKPTAGESSVGLGLFIVKQLVDSMNGMVWAESEPGKGSTFWVEFPRDVHT